LGVSVSLAHGRSDANARMTRAQVMADPARDSARPFRSMRSMPPARGA
jgi:hypothetical protein